MKFFIAHFRLPIPRCSSDQRSPSPSPSWLRPLVTHRTPTPSPRPSPRPTTPWLRRHRHSTMPPYPTWLRVLPPSLSPPQCGLRVTSGGRQCHDLPPAWGHDPWVRGQPDAWGRLTTEFRLWEEVLSTHLWCREVCV